MEERDGIKHQTDVAMTLTNHLIATVAKDKNFVYSPVSIHLVLSLIAAGAKGETLDELLKFLKSESIYNLGRVASQTLNELLVDGVGRGGPKLAVVNGAWIDRSCELREKFDQVVKEVYKSDIKKVDFRNEPDEVTSEVNSWAYEKTSGLITDILPDDSVDSNTQLILTNALCFAGSWVNEFDPSATKYRTFHLLDIGTVIAPFMTNDMDRQYIAQFDGFKVLELPYIRGCNQRYFSMHIFLPDAKDGLPALAEKFYLESGLLDKHIPKEPVRTDQFWIPKFKISFGFEASEVLKGLGLVSPFERSEALTEMVYNPSGQGLYVSAMFHKSFIEINEEGTIAAAATAIGFRVGCCHCTKKIDFVADHPFLFVIREKFSGIVLFIGHVLNPLEN